MSSPAGLSNFYTVPDADDPTAVWVSKQYCKDAMAGKDRISHADPNGAQVICTSDDILHPEQQQQCLKMRGLTIVAARRRLITQEALEYIQQQSPEVCWLPRDSEECLICSSFVEAERSKEVETKVARAEMKRHMKSVYEEQGLCLRTGVAYYLLDRGWVEDLKLYIQTHKFETLEQLDNSRLLVRCHAPPAPPAHASQVTAPGIAVAIDVDDDDNSAAACKGNRGESDDVQVVGGWMLKYDPLDLSELHPPFIWVTQQDWDFVRGKFGGGPEVRVVPQLPPDADGRQRNIRTLDEKLVLRSTLAPGAAPGKKMRLLAGPHAGLLCQVLQVTPPSQAGGTGEPVGTPQRDR